MLTRVIADPRVLSLAVSFAVLLSAPSLGAAERWVTPDGRTYFGNNPPAGSVPAGSRASGSRGTSANEERAAGSVACKKAANAFERAYKEKKTWELERHVEIAADHEVACLLKLKEYVHACNARNVGAEEKCSPYVRNFEACADMLDAYKDAARQRLNYLKFNDGSFMKYAADEWSDASLLKSRCY